jgi:guanine deaminase
MVAKVETFVAIDKKVFHDIEIPIKDNNEYFFKTVISPGFSDAHAHPHVIEKNCGRKKWKNMRDWFNNRRTKINEISLRKDMEICIKLSKLTLYKALLEGTTLIALVSSNPYANSLAFQSMKNKPRTIILPTISNLKGMNKSFKEIKTFLEEIEKIKKISELINYGLFIHSLSFINLNDFIESAKWCYEKNKPFALHLSEGFKELGNLREKIRNIKHPNPIIGVHCTENENYHRFEVKTVNCPLSNLLIYGKTQRNFNQIDCLGTDWPLVIGGIDKQLKELIKIHGKEKIKKIFEKATIGGYELYGMPYDGDFIAFNTSFENILKGKIIHPSYVFINYSPVVKNGKIIGLNLSYKDILNNIEKTIKIAHEKYSE